MLTCNYCAYLVCIVNALIWETELTELMRVFMLSSYKYNLFALFTVHKPWLFYAGMNKRSKKETTVKSRKLLAGVVAFRIETTVIYRLLISLGRQLV